MTLIFQVLEVFNGTGQRGDVGIGLVGLFKGADYAV
jgi:hypothetical protein